MLQDVLDALTESVQKQQHTRDEVQERYDQETSKSDSHKQRSKDLTERLQMEDAKLQRKQQNLKDIQSLKEAWNGVCPPALCCIAWPDCHQCPLRTFLHIVQLKSCAYNIVLLCNFRC